MAYDRDLAERLRHELDGEPGLSEKAMFGGLAFLLDGRMAMAAAGSGGGLLLRCDPADTDTHAAQPGVARFVMRGREMTGWLAVDPSVIADEESLARWVAVGTSYARTLPPAATP